MKISFLLPMVMASLFACEDLNVFTALYDQHIQLAKEKNETEYKKLLTQNAIDFIETHVNYFRKQKQDRSFMDIVSNSVKTDPLRTKTTQYDCTQKDTKAMVIYINQFQTYTNLFAVIYKKEKNIWKIDEFLESESPNSQIDAYLQNMKNVLQK